MSPNFSPGDMVRVKRSHPPGHRRTPFYIRGKSGFIERYCGVFPNPEERAYGFSGLPKRPLYRVRFKQRDVWHRYDGTEADTVDLELFEHWLEPAET